jgi:hypothetical protein
MQPADVVGRSELAGYLTGAPYPAVREQLIEVALEQHAPDHVVDEVRRLPSGRAFANVGDVWSTLGGGTERERF